MRNAVTLLHPKRAIARYNALPITATECARALCTCACVLRTCACAFNIIESAIMNNTKMKQPSILQYLKSLVVFFMELA